MELIYHLWAFSFYNAHRDVKDTPPLNGVANCKSKPQNPALHLLFFMILFSLPREVFSSSLLPPLCWRGGFSICIAVWFIVSTHLILGHLVLAFLFFCLKLIEHYKLSFLGGPCAMQTSLPHYVLSFSSVVFGPRRFHHDIDTIPHNCTDGTSRRI